MSRFLSPKTLPSTSRRLQQRHGNEARRPRCQRLSQLILCALCHHFSSSLRHAILLLSSPIVSSRPSGTSARPCEHSCWISFDVNMARSDCVWWLLQIVASCAAFFSPQPNASVYSVKNMYEQRICNRMQKREGGNRAAKQYENCISFAPSISQK